MQVCLVNPATKLLGYLLVGSREKLFYNISLFSYATYLALSKWYSHSSMMALRQSATLVHVSNPEPLLCN